MNKIFNSASCIVLGMFCTTPVEVLSRESPLMHFFDVFKRKNHLFLIKKLTGPDNHPIKHLIEFELSHPETQHPSPTHSMLDNQLTTTYDFDHIKTIKHHMINPCEDFNININNFNIKKEEAKSTVEDQIEAILARNEHLIFRVRLNALQLFTSCTPIWSAKVCTPIFLEWEAVHSNTFGEDTFPLQNF
jgi:hypothetical protein